MGQMLRLRNILTSFDDFETDDLSSRDADYRSILSRPLPQARAVKAEEPIMETTWCFGWS